MVQNNTTQKSSKLLHNTTLYFATLIGSDIHNLWLFTTLTDTEV